jgi:hypothetical protein
MDWGISVAGSEKNRQLLSSTYPRVVSKWQGAIHNAGEQ